MQPQLNIGEHWLVSIYHSHNALINKLCEFHMDTLFTAWIAMAGIILFSLVVTKKLSRIPDGLQAFAEMVMEFIESIAVGQIGKDGYKHVPLIGSLFLFILIGNLLGQLPWNVYHLAQGELASPTNDLNVTVALALFVSIYYFGFGISKKGIKYFGHYLKPFWFLLPINILEDFTRPLTLALRLFGNIIAGEIIIMLALTFVPFLVPIPVMLFELFVAVIQAFIFSVLSASYIAVVTEEH